MKVLKKDICPTCRKELQLFQKISNQKAMYRCNRCHTFYQVRMPMLDITMRQLAERFKKE